jgi:two-component system CheB/CheR fusion protein
VENIPPELLERYFEASDDRCAFRPDLRRTLIFGRNNLVHDAPISRLDLLVCRNTLMYLNAETQGHILRRFHFALRDAGILLLGKSEMVISHRELFVPVNRSCRIFRKVPQSATLQARVSGMITDQVAEAPMTDEYHEARDAALELALQPQLIVTRTGVLGYANVAARALFDIGTEQVGRPFAQLPIAREPIELEGAIEHVMTQRKRLSLGDASFTPANGQERYLDVTVAPLLSSGNVALGALVVFEDVSRYQLLQQELVDNRKELEAAYEGLQSAVDELETTNEELQSANEELQTTNEELQSTNEELETMNEELSSTNEELETINDELRERTGELNSVNEFLEAILTSLGVAVAVVDRAQQVQVWNRGAEELWGLREDEATDQHFMALDIGLHPEWLAPALRSVISGASAKETAQLDAINRRGRAVVCDTTVMPLIARGVDGPEVRGAIVLMEDHRAAQDGRKE